MVLRNTVSADAHGRKAGASTKKQGRGKGNWGRPGDEYNQDDGVMDKGDPNYDDEAQPIVLVASE